MDLDENERIDPRNEADLERWSAKLKVSKEELRKAAERVGPRLGDIRQNLVGAFNPRSD
ncbi:MAG TPA: DUF3606 domain-containing protein [Terriglobales bacterium]|nr:DUF3606 domain-containing protein [Terriglobales bacterium]